MTQPGTDVATTSGALAIRPGQARWSDEQLAALRHIGAEKATRADLDVFFHQCARTGLDPFLKQIYLISYGGRPTIQVGIDGFRLVARRAADRAGQTVAYRDTQWCGQDGVWTDVWLSQDPPAAARAVVVRGGEEFAHVAMYREFVGTRQSRNGGVEPNDQWAKRPAHMLAKVAEAGALRKAFPADLSGVYAPEELRDQADTVQGEVVRDVPRPALDHALGLVAAATTVDELVGIWNDTVQGLTVTERAHLQKACADARAAMPEPEWATADEEVGQ